jgi:IS5 family transposase
VAQRISATSADGRTHHRLAGRCNRKVRYRGVAKNDHWLHLRAAALNLRRLIGLGLIHNGGAWALA